MGLQCGTCARTGTCRRRIYPLQAQPPRIQERQKKHDPQLGPGAIFVLFSIQRPQNFVGPGNGR
eukprot:4681522-Pyramimonas_sp.AAC.1